MEDWNSMSLHLNDLAARVNEDPLNKWMDIHYLKEFYISSLGNQNKVIINNEIIGS